MPTPHFKPTIFAVILYFFSFSSAQSFEDPILISADYWCPYNCGENDVNKGVFVEVAEAAFATLGRQVRYVELPWTRAQRSLQTGQIDILLGAGSRDEEELVLNLDLNLHNDMVFMVRADSSIDLTDPNEILKQRLGTISEYTYGNTEEQKALIDNHPRKIGVDTLNGPRKLVELLSVGRVDIVAENHQVLRYFAKEMGLEGQFKFHKTNITATVGYGFAPTKEGSVLERELAQGIKNIKASGKLEEIFKKYDFKYSFF